MPEGTRVEIRTRTGQTPNPSLYFAENTNGDLDQIALKDYLKIDVGRAAGPGVRHGALEFLVNAV